MMIIMMMIIIIINFKHIRLLFPKAVLGKRKPPLKFNLRFSKDIAINFKCSIQQVQMKYYIVEFFGTVSEVQKERGTLVVVRSHHPKINVVVSSELLFN